MYSYIVKMFSQVRQVKALIIYKTAKIERLIMIIKIDLLIGKITFFSILLLHDFIYLGRIRLQMQQFVLEIYLGI